VVSIVTATEIEPSSSVLMVRAAGFEPGFISFL
jgi:hypothetical protein